MLSSINDLEGEKSDKKILSYTVKWKNVEWTFDCSQNDFSGHQGTLIDFPHYHFQMRIDGKQFINFNDYHVPFTDEDVFVIKHSMGQGPWLKQNFGAIGSGMQDAISVDFNSIIKHAIRFDDEDEATYHFSTIIDASKNPISIEKIDEMQKEAERTGKPLALIAQQRLKGCAKVRTVISPAESIPDIASRTKHKRR